MTIFFWYDLKLTDRGGVAWLCARLADSHCYSREVPYGDFRSVDERLQAKYGRSKVAELYSDTPVVLLRAVCCEAERIADFGLSTEGLARTRCGGRRVAYTKSGPEPWVLDLS